MQMRDRWVALVLFNLRGLKSGGAQGFVQIAG